MPPSQPAFAVSGKLTRVETCRVGGTGATASVELQQADNAVAEAWQAMGIPTGQPAL